MEYCILFYKKVTIVFNFAAVVPHYSIPAVASSVACYLVYDQSLQ